VDGPTKSASWLGVVLFVAALITIPPWQPDFDFTSGDDPTWYLFHHVFFRRPVWGVELIDTYGPMAFVWHRFYHPETYALSIILNSALAAVLAWGTWIATRAAPWPWLARLGAGLIVLAMFAADRDCRPIVLAALLLLLAPSDDDEPSREAALFRLSGVAALGLYATIKTSVAIAAVVWFATVLGLRLFARRGSWLELAVLPLSVAAWLFFAGQTPDNWATYYKAAFFYVQDVGRFIRWGRVEELVVFLVAGPIYGLFALRWLFRRQGASGLGTGLGLAALLFLAFKAGFVTHNGHHVTHAFAALIAIFALHATLEGGDVAAMVLRHPRLRIATMILGGAATALFAGWLAVTPGFYVHKLPRLWAAIKAVPLVLTGKHDHAKSLADSWAELRHLYPLPKTEGPVSLYVWRGPLAAVIANGGDLRHYVTLHGYFWPETLDSLNRGFFAGERRPNDVIVGNLLASTAELTIAENYRPVAAFETTSGTWYRFSRRTTPARLIEAGEPKSVEGPWRRRLDLPEFDADAVVAEFELRPTLAGRVASLLFKLPTLELRHVAMDGERAWRADIPYGRNRLVLDPYFKANAADLAALASGERKRDKRAVALEFGLDEGAFAWLADIGLEPNIRVTLHPLKWERPPG